MAEIVESVGSSSGFSTVSGVSMSFQLTGNPRKLDIPAETRIYAIEAENRTLEIPAP